MEALGDPIAPPDSRERPHAAGGPVDHLDLLAQASLAGVVSQLTNGLAHETRNSLNALAIHLEVLADKLREPGSEQVPAHLDKNLQAARTQIRRLDDTLRRFGEFAAGRSESSDLAALLSNAGALCAYHLRRSGAELIFDLPERVLLRGDPALLSQLAVEVVLFASAAGAGARTRFGATAASGIAAIRMEIDSERGGCDASEGLQALVARLGGRIVTGSGSFPAWEMSLPLARGERSG